MFHLGEFGKYDKIVTVSKIGIKYIILYFLEIASRKFLGLPGTVRRSIQKQNSTHRKRQSP